MLAAFGPIVWKAFPLGTKPIAASSADSALVVTLPAGAYSVEVTGAGGATGVAFPELYEVPLP